MGCSEKVRYMKSTIFPDVLILKVINVVVGQQNNIKILI